MTLTIGDKTYDVLHEEVIGRTNSFRYVKLTVRGWHQLPHSQKVHGKTGPETLIFTELKNG